MIVNIDNEKKIIRIIKNNKDTYEYYIKDEKTQQYKLIGGYNPLIGKFDPKIVQDKIQFKENTLENEKVSQIKDQLNNIREEDIEKEAIRNKKIKDYADNNGLEIKDFAYVDLEEKIEEDKKTPENKKENKEKNEQTKVDDLDVKQEIDTNERANDMKNLRQWLGNTIPTEYTKMVVIDVDNARNIKDEEGKKYDLDSSKFFNLALVDKKGNVVPLQKYVDIGLRRAAGTNPEEGRYQVNTKGEVEEDPILDEYELNVNGRKKVIQIDYSDYGIIQVNIGEKERGSNEVLTTEMETAETEIRHIKELSVIEEYDEQGEDRVNDSLDEANYEKALHGKDDKLVTEQIDGDEYTKEESHNNVKTKQQIHLSKEFIEQASKVMLEDDEITSCVYNSKDIMEKSIQKLEENGFQIGNTYETSDIEKIKEIMKEVNDDIEKEADGQRVIGPKDENN